LIPFHQNFSLSKLAYNTIIVMHIRSRHLGVACVKVSERETRKKQLWISSSVLLAANADV